MILLIGLLQLAIVGAITAIPAWGIAETYGAATGWLSFFVLAGLFTICYELKNIKEALEKEFRATAERARLKESYDVQISKYQGDLLIVFRELSQNIDFIKERL